MNIVGENKLTIKALSFESHFEKTNEPRDWVLNTTSGAHP